MPNFVSIDVRSGPLMLERNHGIMNLEGNPWITLPEAVVERGLSALKAYLTDVRTAKDAGVGPTCLKLLKVVLVGSSRAGKTRYDAGSLPKYWSTVTSTHGIRQTALTLLLMFYYSNHLYYQRYRLYGRLKRHTTV